MCVRTKTSYGCGCLYKATNECESSRCTGLERYHYIHEGDCKSCKTGGETITRGREGKGRYAQEIRRQSPPVDIPSSTGPRIDVSGGASPWANSGRRGDAWHSPTRVKADDAWEYEHETRLSDLQSRAERMSISAPTSSPRARRRSPSPDEELSDPYYSHDDSYARSQKPLARTLFGEVKGIKDAHPSRRRAAYADERHESQDSLSSLPKLRHSAKTFAYESRDPYDSGYGSYDSYDSRRSHRRPPGARTEPYTYSTPSQRRTYEVPVSPAQYGYPVGSYGVEVQPSARYLSRW